MTLADKLGFGPKREAVPQSDGTVLVTNTPPTWTGFKPSSLRLTADQYARYERWIDQGGSIRQFLPELSVDDQEILMSGIGPKDWDKFLEEQR